VIIQTPKHKNVRTNQRSVQRREFRPEVENQSPSAVQLEQSPQPDAQSQLARDEGNALLNELEAVLRRFIWLPNERDYTILALWVVYTHAFDLFDHAPRIALHSPVPGCGKSTLFRILRALVRLGAIWTTPTEATLFRDMAATHPTILFDEMDKYIYRSSAILALLNAGHMVGATVPRVVGEGEDLRVVHFNVFGPVAFALKAKSLPADLAERSFRIDMQRKLAKLEKLTPAQMPSLNALGVRVVEWVKHKRKAIEDCRDRCELPDQIINRAGDNWLPLFAIAEAAGGDWARRATNAALDYDKHNPSEDRGILLLGNLKSIIERTSKTFFSSSELCAALNDREDWTWGEYAYGDGVNTHKLANLLKPFGIIPRQARMTGSGKLRGYHKRDFETAWHTYDIRAEDEASGQASLA